MNEKLRLRIAQQGVYVLLLGVLYVLQTTPGFLQVGGVRPNLVVPAAICIAMLEGEFLGGVYGALAGVLCDLGGMSIFGFNGIILLAAGVAAGLAFIYLLRPCLANFLLVTLGALAARGLLDYFFNYYMWGYRQVWRVLALEILPVVAYSTLLAPLPYLLCRWVYGRFRQRLED